MLETHAGPDKGNVCSKLIEIKRKLRGLQSGSHRSQQRHGGAAQVRRIILNAHLFVYGDKDGLQMQDASTVDHGKCCDEIIHPFIVK